MGPLQRRRNRTIVKDLEARIGDADRGVVSLQAGLEGLEREMRTIEQAQVQRDEWLLENAPTVRKLDALGRELWWREQQQALAAEVAMPQYLVNAVGERPMKPSERGAWHEAVKAVESYRSRWGVDDPEHALGSERDSDNAEQVAVERQIADARAESGEVEVEVRERSLEL